MSNIITMEDAKMRFEDLVAGTKRGEEWLIIDADGLPMARLSSSNALAPATGERWEAFGMMKGQIELAPDFDAPLEDFKAYME